jgi:hypothetical protein
MSISSTRSALRILIVLMVAFTLGGCNGGKNGPRTTGFLSDYSKLENASDSSMRYHAPRETIARYRAFIVDPVEVRFTPTDKSKVTPDDLEHIAAYFRGKVIDVLSEDYQIVSQPGPNVARFRIALTDVSDSTWWLNVHPGTRLTGAGAGGAGVEGELVDSQTGEQLAALVETQAGSRIGFDGLSKVGDAKAVIDDWAKRVHKRLEEARAGGAARVDN